MGNDDEDEDVLSESGGNRYGHTSMESVGCEFPVLYRNSLGTLISFLRPILYYLSPDPHIQPRTSESDHF